jgi:hypothetical protein
LIKDAINLVQARAEAGAPGEQRVAAEPEQAEIERLVRLLLAVALDFAGTSLRWASITGPKNAGF